MMSVERTVGRMWRRLYDASDLNRDFSLHRLLEPENPHVQAYLWIADMELTVAEGMHRLLEAGSPDYAKIVKPELERQRGDLEGNFEAYYQGEVWKAKLLEEKVETPQTGVAYSQKEPGFTWH